MTLAGSIGLDRGRVMELKETTSNVEWTLTYLCQCQYIDMFVWRHWAAWARRGEEDQLWWWLWYFLFETNHDNVRSLSIMVMGHTVDRKRYCPWMNTAIILISQSLLSVYLQAYNNHWSTEHQYRTRINKVFIIIQGSCSAMTWHEPQSLYRGAWI